MFPSRSQNCFPELQPSLSHFSKSQPRNQIGFIQNEVNELEELRKKRNMFYEAKIFVVKCRRDVQGLRNRVNEVTLTSQFHETFLLFFIS
ncbi:hypothetical protein AHAS_Ahas02G0141900 [Arachis hypogaea]